MIKPRESIDAAVSRWRRIIKQTAPSSSMRSARSRTPEAGFMNLDRDLVCRPSRPRLPGVGRDRPGPNANGDMMHFDCRATGIGWKLSLPQQRTARRQPPVRQSERHSRGAGDCGHAFCPRNADPFSRRAALDLYRGHSSDEHRRLLSESDQFPQERRRPGLRAWAPRPVPTRAEDDARRSHHQETIRVGQTRRRLQPGRSCSSSHFWIGATCKPTT